MSRTTRLIGSAVTGTLVLVATAAAASADTPSVAIGPNQTFAGLVNGHLANAKVDVICPGPLRTAETGHPASGQTLGVTSAPPTIASTGFTGSRGRSIMASFVTPTAAGTATVTFTQYGTQPIPTTFLLPCYGSGSVVFAPHPTSHSARSAQVSVTFSSTCTNPCPVTSERGAAALTRTNTVTDGTITGQLGFEGGPAPGGFHPTAGLVKVAGSKTIELVKVPESGNFTVHVKPGGYALTGCGGTQDNQCGPRQDVTVKAGATTHVQVVWALAP